MDRKAGEFVYDIILFDFDGTVYDTVEGITKSVRYAINKQGLDAELGELRCFAGPPLDDMFREKFGFTEEQVRTAVADFRERYNPIGVYESRPFPGMGELLAALRRAGKTLGVATSKPQALAEQLLNESGLREQFDIVRGSDPRTVNNAKWQVVTWAMEGLGADPARTVLVGDTRYDVEGAHRCGIPCLGVGWGYAAAGELEAAGVDGFAADMPALQRMLLEP